MKRKMLIPLLVFVWVGVHWTCWHGAAIPAEKIQEEDREWGSSGLAPANPEIFKGAKWGMDVEEVEQVIGEKLLLKGDFNNAYEKLEYATYGEHAFYRTDKPVYESIIERDGKKEVITTVMNTYIFKKDKDKQKLVEIDVCFEHRRPHGTVGMIRLAIIQDLISKYDVLLTRTKYDVFSMYLKSNDTFIHYREYPSDNLGEKAKEERTYIAYKILTYKNIF